MKMKTKVKAGGKSLNSNQTAGVPIKTRVKAGDIHLL